MSLPTVSVVIPTFNRAHLLDRAIRPVLDDDATSEVIVVIDGGNDGSAELLKRHYGDDRRVRTVVSEHLGPAGALDVGVQEASGEVIVTIDDDVVASPGGISLHAEHHLDERDRVVLGYMPVVLGPASSRATSMYAAAYEQRVGEYERHPLTVLPFLWGGYFSLLRDTALRVPFRNPGMPIDLLRRAVIVPLIRRCTGGSDREICRGGFAVLWRVVRALQPPCGGGLRDY